MPVQWRKDPLLSPNLLSIAWAAGIYEGEGSCQFSKNNSLQASVCQKERWLCDVLLELFGGTVVESHQPQVFRWYVYGPYAAGFLMTMYKFLSPRRKEQIGIALDKWKARK